MAQSATNQAKRETTPQPFSETGHRPRPRRPSVGRHRHPFQRKKRQRSRSNPPRPKREHTPQSLSEIDDKGRDRIHRPPIEGHNAACTDVCYFKHIVFSRQCDA
eukprot:5198529-Pyramimonas_sp.AAC.1